jgi:hypothetical protein
VQVEHHGERARPPGPEDGGGLPPPVRTHELDPPRPGRGGRLPLRRRRDPPPGLGPALGARRHRDRRRRRRQRWGGRRAWGPRATAGDEDDDGTQGAEEPGLHASHTASPGGRESAAHPGVGAPEPPAWAVA